ncbi:MAG: NAD(P)/FAD-dependent oxidoreductase [Acidaminococcaceae bacterium]
MMTEQFDIAIIGGGPAGLSAAVTGAVRNKKIIIFDIHGFSPRLRKAHLVSNYLGFPEISGEELMNKFVEHALSFEPTVIKEKVMAVTEQDGSFSIATPKGFYEAKTIILAVGVSSSDVLSGEKEFLGRGVSYCATCDGYFYKGKKIAAIATVPEALEEIEFLAELCEEVIFLPRYELKTLPRHKNIKVVVEKPIEITGTDKVTGLRTTEAYYGVQGVFIFRESDPIDNLFPSLQLRGKSIYVDDQLTTNIEGIFAAGDCTGQPWQISRATGQGLRAALSAVSYLGKQK